MTGVLTMGFKAEAFVAGQGDIPWFSERSSRDDYETLVDTVARGLDQSGHLIAVYPAWDPEPALRRLETVRAALKTRHVVPYPTSLPPLAGAVLASLASSVASYVDAPGVLYAGLPKLERELLVLAWLQSVASLKHPAPSMWQHLRSLSFGSSFGVSFWPEPAVKLLTRKDRSVPVPTTYRPMVLAVAAREGDSSWVEEVVAPALGSPPVRTFDSTPLGPSWWGTAKLVEAVGYPIDVPVTARRITEGLTPSLCKWCGEAIAAPACPFCRLDASQPSLVGGVA